MKKRLSQSCPTRDLFSGEPVSSPPAVESVTSYQIIMKIASTYSEGPQTAIF